MDINLFSCLFMLDLDKVELPDENVTHMLTGRRHNEPVDSPFSAAIVMFAREASGVRRKRDRVVDGSIPFKLQQTGQTKCHISSTIKENSLYTNTIGIIF